jgi:DNA repair protein RadC
VSTRRLLQAVRGHPHLLPYFLELAAEPPAQAYVTGAHDALAAVSPYLVGLDQEVLVVVALNRRHRVVAGEVLTRGSDRFTVVDPRQIFRWALLQGRSGAHAILLAHNHPSGDPTPSQQDRDVTRRCARAGSLLGIPVLDHIIVARDMSWSSLRLTDTDLFDADEQARTWSA